MNNRVVAITAAAAGDGRAVVRQFAHACGGFGLIARGVDGRNGAKKEVLDLLLAGGTVSVPYDHDDRSLNDGKR